MPSVTVQTESIQGGEELSTPQEQELATPSPLKKTDSLSSSSGVPTPTRNSARIQQRAAAFNKTFAFGKKRNITEPSKTQQKLSRVNGLKKKIPPLRKNCSGKVFSIPKHIEIIEGSGGLLYKCTVGKCNSKAPFKSRTNIKYHRDCVDGNKRRFQCTKCERKFAIKTHLQYHLSRGLCVVKQIRRIANNVTQRRKLAQAPEIEPKRMVCQCGDKFRHKETLEYHQKMMHHGPGGQKPSFEGFDCMLCDIKIRRWANLRRHICKVHKTDDKRATELVNTAKERALQKKPSARNAAFGGQQCGNDGPVAIIDLDSMKVEGEDMEEATGETSTFADAPASSATAAIKENQEESYSVADSMGIGDMEKDNDVTDDEDEEENQGQVEGLAKKYYWCPVM